jgi:hypothetical protein
MGSNYCWQPTINCALDYAIFRFLKKYLNEKDKTLLEEKISSLPFGGGNSLIIK